jgi:NAD(P)-dependent dehydrogenase (short-subunit alcohol dehydrogenase family)
VVLITGAESGIGRETALRAAREGADIAAIGLDAVGLDRMVGEVRAFGRRAQAARADVSDPVVLTAVVDELVAELPPEHATKTEPELRLTRLELSDLD